MDRKKTVRVQKVRKTTWRKIGTICQPGGNEYCILNWVNHTKIQVYWFKE